MCRPATCKSCGKTTWAGCGQHVDQVMRSVPTTQRCPGHASPASSATPASSASSTSGGFLGRLFGR